jgi:hypothetical protein
MARSVANRVHNGCDIIDSRDIIERIEELEGEIIGATVTWTIDGDGEEPAQGEVQGVEENAEGGVCLVVTPTRKDVDTDVRLFVEDTDLPNDSDDLSELLMLRALVKELDSTAGESAHHGITMIRDSYFEDYARELAEDIGAIDRNATWPNNYIDWEAAADALKTDYSTVDFDGIEYWVRA